MAAHQGILIIVTESVSPFHKDQVPLSYLANNWPIRYASISNDGRLVAVAGRRGLVHYSAASGRWKFFNDMVQEQAFSARGGLIWFHHVLIAAVDASGSYQVIRRFDFVVSRILLFFFTRFGCIRVTWT